MYLGAKHLDTENVKTLSPAIFCTHVDDAFQAEASTDSGGRDSMLTGTRLRDDSFLAESFSQKDLSSRVQ